MTLSPATPPPIEALSPDLQFKLWERQQNKVKRSWILTLLLCSPAIVFITIKPVNDAVSVLYQGATFLHWLTGLAALPQPGSGAVTLPAGTAGLEPEQLTTAEKIIQAGIDRGLDQSDIKLGLMASMQESSLKELDHGDDWYFAQFGQKSDSVGAFQQRDSWGDRQCRIDAKCAANLFFDALAQVPDRKSLPEWQTIAKVQKPAKQYEQAYQQWSDVADELLQAVQSTPGAVSGGVFPLSGKSIADVNSNYGMRINPVTHQSLMHWGVDIPADAGAPIAATQAGKVIATQMGSDACGGQVEIRHADGNGERICHASELLVKVGDQVSAGQIIAKVGSTGRATGPHLHFERTEGGSSVDPTAYLTALSGGDQQKSIASPPPVQQQPAVSNSASVPAGFVGIQTSGGLCSGFAVAADRIVTANHCIESQTVTVVPQSGEWLQGSVIKQDTRVDLALIQVDGASFSPVSIASSLPAVGAELVSFGHPQGQSLIASSVVKVTSASADKITVAYSSGEKIVGGFSGGPVLSASGELVGLNNEANSVGAAQIIPASVVKRFLSSQNR